MIVPDFKKIIKFDREFFNELGKKTVVQHRTAVQVDGINARTNKPFVPYTTDYKRRKSQGKAVKEGQVTKYGRLAVDVGGKLHELQYVTNLQNQILDNYTRYTDYDKQSKEGGYSGDYYAEQRAQYALKIKQQVGYMLKNQFQKY